MEEATEEKEKHASKAQEMAKALEGKAWKEVKANQWRSKKYNQIRWHWVNIMYLY